MKILRSITFIFILFVITNCATITRNFDSVERDEFLNKFPLVNSEILGELKYDDPNLDLRTLGLNDYRDLFTKLDLTEDYKESVINSVQNNTSELIFVVRQDTFIVCLRSDDYDLAVCDDASTEMSDKVHVGKPIPALEKLYKDLGVDFK